MVKVQIRDAQDRDKVYIDQIVLAFDPRLSKRIRIRKGRYDAKHRTYQIIDTDGVNEIVTDEPDQSSIVVYVTEIRD